ncbi:MAG: NUDIX domain-containing protein [Actinomycetia bacterium]|nr:NUDIX domain-containing protein [Actinomycetes bacterium]
MDDARGGLEWGESPEDTVKRELQEEAGLDGEADTVLGVFSRWFAADKSPRGDAGHVLDLGYEMGQLRAELRTDWIHSTTDEAAWFTLAEIQTLPRVPLVDFVVSLL